MAMQKESKALLDELLCPICLDFFQDPTTLACDHSFCHSCISQFWKSRKGIFSCPECRQTSPIGSMRRNRILANLAERARSIQETDTEKEKEDDFYCHVHGEKMKLFCESDLHLMCLVCRDGPDHQGHVFIPVIDAMNKYKGKVQTRLLSFLKQKMTLSDKQFKQEEEISKVKNSSKSMMDNIEKEFAELHQFLNEKEKTLKEQLVEETTRILRPMEASLQHIKQVLASLNDTILLCERKLNLSDEVQFLKDMKQLNCSFSEQLGELQPVPGKLSISKFSGPLQYVVWKDIRKILRCVPVPVTLDPRTASPFLILSKDRTSVRCGDTMQNLPDYQERFQYDPCVLTSQGFTSGRHYWEVEVADLYEWTVGVAKESISRKQYQNRTQESVYWTLQLWHGKHYMASSLLCTSLSLKSRPQKIGVFLDYEAGHIIFYDAGNMTELYTFSEIFTEKLFPFLDTHLSDTG